MSLGLSARAPSLGSTRDTFDWPLFLAASALAVVGVVNLYSATSVAHGALSDIYIQQVYWLVFGGVLAAGAAVIDYRNFERLGYAAYVLGVVSLVLVFVLGRDIRGSSRWVYIGSFSLQPSEFMKIFLILALAKFVHDDPKSGGRTLRDLIVPAVIAAVPIFLVLRQPDLGTAIILFSIFASMMALTRITLGTVIELIVGAAFVLPLSWYFVLKDYQKQRITSFLNPEANILGANWHAHHARVAIGNGKLTGQGFMRGTQNQFLFVPDQHSDFPFAVFAEDWGFIGAIALIGLYAFIVLWSIRIASMARDRFGAAIAVGVGAMIFWHAFYNIGMVCGLLPVVGITLPLFSYGGSSVLTTLLGIGLLLNVSMRRHQTSSLGPRTLLG